MGSLQCLLQLLPGGSQCRFGSLALGDVAEDHDQAFILPVRPQWRYAMYDRKETSVIPNEDVFVIAQWRASLTYLKSDAFLDWKHRTVWVLVVRHLVNFAAEQFACSVAEQSLRRWIDVIDEAWLLIE